MSIRITARARASFLLGMVAALNAPANDEPKQHDFWFDGRMRLEAVSQDNLNEDASALTLRSRLGYSTGDFNGFEFLVEAENIFALDDSYNSTTNGQSDRPVVADPEDTEINRVLIRYRGFADNVITVGRQRLQFDNARHIGVVAWRQNEQTYDAISVRNTSFKDTTINVAYVDMVRRIFGPDSPIGTTDMSSPLVNIKYDGFENGELSVYGYFLDFNDAPVNSNQTFGFRYTGHAPIGDNKFEYIAEYAQQTDYRSGANLIDAHYLQAGAGITIAGVRYGIDYNVLSGDGTYAFQTPLATAHAFNGWADLFLRTPNDGLQDLNINIKAKLAGFNVRALYHEFTADNGSLDYGTELNLIATRKFENGIAAGFKFADYSADEFGVDVTKFWLWAGIKY